MEAFERKGERMTDTPIHGIKVKSALFLNVKVNMKSKLIPFSFLIHVPSLMESIHTAAKYGCHSSSECSVSFSTLAPFKID